MTNAVKAGMDALLIRAVCVTPVLVMAVFRAVRISSPAFPDAGVNAVVIGLMELNAVRPLRAVRSLASAASTLAWVMAVSVVALNPENHTPGVAVPARLATIRSVSGVIFTVPADVAMEW